jgi:protein associated with RNAse G/E
LKQKKKKKNRKKFQHKRKRYSWNFELNNALLKMVKTHLEWIEQEVALAFIHHYPHLSLNTLQIK